MTVNQMKRVLAKCQQGKTLLIIAEKRQRGQKRRLRYFAVFDHFVEKHDPRYTDGAAPPNWLYVRTDVKRNHSMILQNVYSISIIPSAELRSLCSGCRRILSKEIFSPDDIYLAQDQLELVAGFLNALLKVNPVDYL